MENDKLHAFGEFIANAWLMHRQKVTLKASVLNLFSTCLLRVCVVFRALETNKYNHITATYYLLAERILREKQEKEVQTRSSSPSNIKAQFR